MDGQVGDTPRSDPPKPPAETKPRRNIGIAVFGAVVRAVTTDAFTRRVSTVKGLVGEGSRPTVERRSRHAEVSSNLGGGFARFNQADSAADLTVCDSLRPAAEIMASGSSLGDGVGDAFAFDLVLHLSERGHDGEEHRAHRGGCVDVAAAKVEDPEAGAAAAELVCEREHVLCGAPEPVEGRDDQSVTGLERGESEVELWPRGAGTGDTSVDVEIISTYAGGEQICLLPVCGLLPRRHPRVSNELRHVRPPSCLITNLAHRFVNQWLRHVVMRI